MRGFKTRIHLYTVPGQVFYDASRKLILRGVDGVVFVADSQQERMDANVEALENLMTNLKEHGYDFNKIPYVLQLNKRDLPNILPVDALSKELRKKNEPVQEAVAFQGVGVFETLERNRQAGAHGVEAGRVGQLLALNCQLSVKPRHNLSVETQLAACALASVMTGLCPVSQAQIGIFIPRALRSLQRA